VDPHNHRKSKIEKLKFLIGKADGSYRLQIRDFQFAILDGLESAGTGVPFSQSAVYAGCPLKPSSSKAGFA
jgi:hypothetical protein